MAKNICEVIMSSRLPKFIRKLASAYLMATYLRPKPGSGGWKKLEGKEVRWRKYGGDR